MTSSDEQRVAAVRVLVVDDHEMFGQSVALVLGAEPDMEVVGVVTDLQRARAAVATLAPDIVLLDQRLPDGDGVAAIPQLQALHSEAKIVVLTATSSEAVLVAAMEAGAAGFLSKRDRLEQLVSGVRLVSEGENTVSPRLLQTLLPRLRRQRHRRIGDDLTGREREVLHLLAEALPNADIAARLNLSVHTVRNHIASLSGKLGAHSKLEALSIAVREGLLDPP